MTMMTLLKLLPFSEMEILGQVSALHVSLNNLQNFHCVTNYNLDVMHDMLEGVCPYEVKLLLNHFIFSEQFFTLSELNQRIRSFHYSKTDKKNKPTALASDRLRNSKDHKLAQKAAVVSCSTASTSCWGSNSTREYSLLSVAIAPSMHGYHICPFGLLKSNCLPEALDC